MTQAINIIDISPNEGWQAAADKINLNFRSLYRALDINLNTSMMTSYNLLSRKLSELSNKLDREIADVRDLISKLDKEVEGRLDEQDKRIDEIADLAGAAPAVGRILIYADDTDPNEVYKGTKWERIGNRFLYGYDPANPSKPLGGMGGSESVTLTASQIPGHKHTMSAHTHIIGAHVHGLNAHVHSVGAHAHGLNGHVHQVGAHHHGLNNHVHSVPAHHHGLNGHTHDMNHVHAISMWRTNSEAANYGLPLYEAGFKNRVLVEASGKTFAQSYKTWGPYLSNGTWKGTTGGNTGNTANSAAFNTGGNSGNTANSAAFNTGGPSVGSTANSTAFNTGASSGNTASSEAFQSGAPSTDSTGSTGGGEAHSNMPPYLVVNMWKRVA